MLLLFYLLVTFANLIFLSVGSTEVSSFEHLLINFEETRLFNF